MLVHCFVYCFNICSAADITLGNSNETALSFLQMSTEHFLQKKSKKPTALHDHILWGKLVLFGINYIICLYYNSNDPYLCLERTTH